MTESDLQAAHFHHRSDGRQHPRHERFVRKRIVANRQQLAVRRRKSPPDARPSREAARCESPVRRPASRGGARFPTRSPTACPFLRPDASRRFLPREEQWRAVRQAPSSPSRRTRSSARSSRRSRARSSPAPARSVRRRSSRSRRSRAARHARRPSWSVRPTPAASCSRAVRLSPALQQRRRRIEDLAIRVGFAREAAGQNSNLRAWRKPRTLCCRVVPERRRRQPEWSESSLNALPLGRLTSSRGARTSASAFFARRWESRW